MHSSNMRSRIVRSSLPASAYDLGIKEVLKRMEEFLPMAIKSLLRKAKSRTPAGGWFIGYI